MSVEVNWSLAPEWATELGEIDGVGRAWLGSNQFRFEKSHDTCVYGGLYRKYKDFTIVANRNGTIKTSQWTAKHYDNFYQLTAKDIEAGKIKVDAYFVNKLWKLNTKDDTGGLFHCLKTVARFGDKNPIERELNALHNQVKRMAELYGVELK